MKKVLAIVLALCMVFALVACGGGSSDTTPKDDGGKQDTTPAPDSGKKDEPKEDTTPADDGASEYPATPFMNEDGSPNLDLISYYDENYDYTQNPQFHVAYMAYSADALYQEAADAIEHFCTLENCIFDGFVSANGDAEAYLNNLQSYVDGGTQMFILDPDLTIFPQVNELLEPYVEKGQVYWMSLMGAPRDEGVLLNTFAGFDYKTQGRECGEWLINWKEENYPDVPWSEFGFISVTLSLSPPLQERADGAMEAILAIDGFNPDNTWYVDTASGGFNTNGGLERTSPIIATHDNIKYWLSYGLVDDVAIGVASAFETAGLADTSCVCSIGGPGMVAQWSAGIQSCCRATYAIPYFIFVEPVFGAVYARANGWCTADTIWPSWVAASDHGGDDHTYSLLCLPSWFITYDSYDALYSWTNAHCKTDYYKCSGNFNPDDYSLFVEAPEGWLD